MELLRKSLLLSSAEVWLLIQAALLVESIKLSMRFVPFQTLMHLLTRVADLPIRPWHESYRSAESVTWAVDVASRRTPGAKSCLTQALAARVMLGRRGYPTLLHIGVARGDQGRFHAHAWLESKGKIVIGASNLEHFTVLATLEGEKPKCLRGENFD